MHAVKYLGSLAVAHEAAMRAKRNECDKESHQSSKGKGMKAYLYINKLKCDISL